MRTSKNPKPEWFTFRLDTPLKEKLIKVAEESERTIAEVVRKLIKVGLEKNILKN